MKISKTRTLSLLTILVLIGGCGSVTTRYEAAPNLPEEIPVLTQNPHYEPRIERGPDYIDALRAEPAPAQPKVIQGKNQHGDQRELAAKGFVRIGNGRYALDDAGSVADSIELGRSVGAEQIWLYHELAEDSSASASSSLLAAYYVRFKLLFGATFRNLNASEREQLQVSGGVQIGAVVGGTPASQANLMAGDYVTSVNGKAVAGRVEFQELLKNEAGKPVTLEVIRNQKRADRVVRLGAMPPVIK